jgi:hypothetical protein
MTHESTGQKAIRDLIYAFTKSIGVIWLVKKLPFLQLKDWVYSRDSARGKQS